jgi:hypothetical protein
MTFKEQIADFITIENAKLYDSKIDKWLWVVDNVLDPAGVSVTDARVNWVEDKFDALLGK